MKMNSRGFGDIFRNTSPNRPLQYPMQNSPEPQSRGVLHAQMSTSVML